MPKDFLYQYVGGPYTTSDVAKAGVECYQTARRIIGLPPEQVDFINPSYLPVGTYDASRFKSKTGFYVVRWLGEGDMPVNLR